MGAEAAFRELLELDVAAGTYDWTMLGFDLGFRGLLQIYELVFAGS